MKLHSLCVVLFLGVLSATSAKGHRGRTHHNHGSATTENPDSRTPFKDGNSKEVHHSLTSPAVPQGMDERTPLVPSDPSATGIPALKRPKKVLPGDQKVLHNNAQEHNVNKKQLDDQDGIPMETEFLIHVTPHPPNTRKGRTSPNLKRRPPTPKGKGSSALTQNQFPKNPKGERGNSRSTTKSGTAKPRRNKQRQNAPQGKRGDSTEQRRETAKGIAKATKGRRYPKKYNWKKNQKEKKQGDRKKEKRDRKGEKKEKREKRNKKMKTANKGNEKKV